MDAEFIGKRFVTLVKTRSITGVSGGRIDYPHVYGIYDTVKECEHILIGCRPMRNYEECKQKAINMNLAEEKQNEKNKTNV